ncbi:CKLF-like MARVEL transmembrane domain-containing protein 1 [Orycteropus afer afer]|uniref:CKLF-like MARVEL transmembrane domain-containing protein 1 n=1 Tax=Orycteropus afer afer TaxID=1230840 RepID=A0A8B6ZS89_ORYAF|nr:CKLF-like MARVEL transmembrane domain-containing protein 1 [Orycteropus afer afer]
MLCARGLEEQSSEEKGCKGSGAAGSAGGMQSAQPPRPDTPQTQAKAPYRPFCLSVKGQVKMMRLDVINSLVTTVFMIIVSVLALIPETTTLTVLGGDLINSIITAVFLLIVAILAMQEKNRRKLFYTGGSLCLAAATVCLIDAFVVTKKMRTTLKTFLQINVEKKQVHPSGHSQMHLSSAHHTPTNS